MSFWVNLAAPFLWSLTVSTANTPNTLLLSSFSGTATSAPPFSFCTSTHPAALDTVLKVYVSNRVKNQLKITIKVVQLEKKRNCSQSQLWDITVVFVGATSEGNEVTVTEGHEFECTQTMRGGVWGGGDILSAVHFLSLALKIVPFGAF